MDRVLFIVSRRKGGPRAASLPAAVKRLPASCLAAVLLATSAFAGECNFEIRGVPAPQGDAIRDHAEKVRHRAFAEILGDDRPRPWRVRCEVHVHPTADAFAAAVGGPPASARGATSIEFTGDEVSLRRIDVLGGELGAIPDALAHELVHVVLADHFTSGPPPRWADEGLALLFDPADKQRGHDADFHEARRHGLAWSSRDLMEMEEYPIEAARQRVFYGQSAALVRWLVARRDAGTFIRFLDDCAVEGEQASLRRHYDIDSFLALDRACRDSPSLTDVGVTAPMR
jgi:hypothetical protein